MLFYFPPIFPLLSISSFLLFPLFLPLLLFHFISLLHQCDDFLSFFCHFPLFLLVLLFILLSLSCISDSAIFFLFFSFLFCLFTSYSSSFLLFQPSFPHSLALLNLNLSSPCSSSSSIPTSFLFSSFLPLLFLLSPSSPLPLHIQLHQCDDFLNFPCHFLGAVLPAPALYPSLPFIVLYRWASTIEQPPVTCVEIIAVQFCTISSS